MASIECCNARGLRTAYQESWYDLNGKKVRQREHIIGGHHNDYTIDWELDCMGRSLSTTENGSKVTRFEYDLAGHLSTIFKPDGMTLNHDYDLFGRLIKLTSSDQSVSYEYTYDINGNMLTINDLHDFSATARTYDAWNRLLTEHLANGLDLEYAYDNFGRLICVTLPDHSLIKYHYDLYNLTGVSRHGIDGATVI